MNDDIAELILALFLGIGYLILTVLLFDLM